MRIGAVIAVARPSSEEDSLARNRTHLSRLCGGSPCVLVEVLGQSIFDRTIAKLKNFGTLPPTTISEGTNSGHFLPPRSARRNPFVSVWEESVANYVRDGVDHLILLRVNAYHEVDYQELFHFHLQTQSSLTQVYAADGSVDLALVSAASLRNADSYVAGVSGLIPQQRQFRYHGYLNRMRNPRDVHRLVQDGLRGRSRLSPVGTEVRPGIWLGDGARVDTSAKLHAPMFVGANSRIAACCEISNATSIERNCEIDCGTTVNQSWVLPNTYVGMSLNVRGSIVSNTRLFHLDRNVAIAFEDGNLVGPRKPSSGLLAKIESFLRSEEGAG